jgi:Putative nuclease YbcO
MSKITKFAQDKDCTLRIPGVCNFNPQTSVWMHPIGLSSGRGMGLKANDALGAIGCSNCHDVYDRRVPLPKHLTRAEIELAFHSGHQQTLLLLIEAGLVKIA